MFGDRLPHPEKLPEEDVSDEPEKADGAPREEKAEERDGGAQNSIRNPPAKKRRRLPRLPVLP